ncbi:UNVERIFIED_CONTAM: protein LURP-one-related 14 [Sesamum radiatum]|uniref:Protein LURP-one-related 14 n=1 Tax=Sesamum radiatum TaxID=300843 RepID=A0AAW2TFA8_SESRA
MFVPDVRRDLVPTVSVVGDDFCFPYLVDLAVKKKVGFSTKHIDVLDDNGALLVQVDGGFWQFNKTRTMLHSLGFPIITMRRTKGIWMQQEWTVHRGESSDGSDLLYTVRKSHSFQLKTRLQVFLATNLTAQICDFRVIGSYISQSFKVYRGDTLMAEVKERFTMGGRLGNERFEARIYPGVDYAFIVSLLVILNEIDF